MNTPDPTTSALYPVRLRQDLPRDVASSYWAGPHAEIVTRLPHLMEYNQYHFSRRITDTGLPRTKVGTAAPPSSAHRRAHRGAVPQHGGRFPHTAAHARGFPRRAERLRALPRSLNRTRGAADGGRAATTTRSVIARCCSCADAEASAARPFARSFIPVWDRRCTPQERETCGPIPSCPWRPWLTRPSACPTTIHRRGAITAPSCSASALGRTLRM